MCFVSLLVMDADQSTQALFSLSIAVRVPTSGIWHEEILCMEFDVVKLNDTGVSIHNFSFIRTECGSVLLH